MNIQRLPNSHQIKYLLWQPMASIGTEIAAKYTGICYHILQEYIETLEMTVHASYHLLDFRGKNVYSKRRNEN